MSKKIVKIEENWKALCYAFVAYNRRCYGLELIKAPEVVVDSEKRKIQTIYNKMREKCLIDPEYIETWEKDIIQEPIAKSTEPEIDLDFC